MKTRSAALEIDARDLATLESLWDGGLARTYEAYRGAAQDARIALAAALVETGTTLQGIGTHIAAPGELLLGDLCLARASRLLADVGDQRLQVGFARVVERVTTEAAEGGEVTDVRDLLRAVLEART